MLERALPTSRHFELEELADGVWAAIARTDGWAVANAGIVDLGGETLVFDSFITPEAARDLAHAAEAVTGRSAAYVIDSHYHNDHIRGSSVFPHARVVATEATRDLIDTAGREELENDRTHAAARLDTRRKMLGSDDPIERENAAFMVPYWEGILASLPEVEVRLPTLTFRDELVFHGSARSAVLRCVGAAHTPDDSVLLLPDDGVAFMSDVLFVECHPWLADGDPDAWLEVLIHAAGWPAERFVPGHGPVGGREALTALAAYIRAVAGEAERLSRDNVPLERLAEHPIPDEYRSWLLAVPFYHGNLRFMTQRIDDGSY